MAKLEYTEDGKRYLVTYVVQEGQELYADQLFKDLKYVVELDEKAGVKVDRKHPAKKILNRFSGSYMSPTFMKSFETCEVSALYGSLAPWVPTDSTSIGTSVHSIFQLFYDLQPEERTEDALDRITYEVVEKNGQTELVDEVKYYVDRYKKAPDYLDPTKPMDHKSLTCFNELFIAAECSPLGVKLPLKIYTLIDRLDYRQDKLFAIDYKTGKKLDKYILTMEGYLPQLISYQWVVEEQYGVELGGAYLCTPGADPIYHELPTSSLKYQSIYIDKIFVFAERFKESAETRRYKEKRHRWCGFCKFKDYCNAFKGVDGVSSQVIEVRYDVTLAEDEEEGKEDLEVAT